MDFSIVTALDLIRNASDEQLQPYLPNITHTIQRLQKLPINTFQHSPPLLENERGHHNSLHAPPGSENVQPSPGNEDAVQASPGSEDAQPFLGNEDDVVQPSLGSVQPSPGNEDVVQPSPESEDVQLSLGSVQPSGNKAASLPPLSSGCMSLLNALSTNLPKIKKFVNASVEKDPKVIVDKPKWLNEHPLVKDLITADGDSSDNAIFRKLLSQWTLADSFEKWQLKSTGASRIECLVESRAASVKGVSHVKLFARSIGCHDVTKAASAIGHGIKLHVIQKLGVAGLLVPLAFTHDACRRLNLPDIDNFLMALQHPNYFMIFEIAQRCSIWMGKCQELYSGQMLSLGLPHLSTTNPSQPIPKKRISSPHLPISKRPRVEVTKPGDPTLARNHRHADLTTSHPPQPPTTASTNNTAASQSVTEAESTLVEIFSGNSDWYRDPPPIPMELYGAHPDIYQGPPQIPLEHFHSNSDMYRGPPPIPSELFDGHPDIYQGPPPITTLCEGESSSFCITPASTTTMNDGLDYYTTAPHIQCTSHRSLQGSSYSDVLNMASLTCQSNAITAAAGQ
ncbi:hypothetical protein AOQ84DRAFT_172751 [Glonium stellatum]|uniref:Uncharacterized protein n=1 Tax=Glonium stellatum TaxID=574774 RepID=A0A8E2F7B6_9PEZI|nr:hypothetical protein AOQ84DRAFT_172751 [Glonium stellatum]